MDPDPDPGGPKTRGSGFGSATLVKTVYFNRFDVKKSSVPQLGTLLTLAEVDALYVQFNIFTVTLCYRFGSYDPCTGL